MRRDLEIPLCLSCINRPIDTDTKRPVEGGINITERVCDSGRAVVLYSQEDPRIHVQRGIDENSDISEAVRRAYSCTPFVEGLEADLAAGSLENRVKRAAQTRETIAQNMCGLDGLLFDDKNLPEGLLYKTSKK